MDRKEELIAAVRAVAARRGVRRLRLATFLRESGWSARPVYSHFESWPALCAAAGLAPEGRTTRIPDDDVFAAMRDAFVALGGLASRKAFARHLPFGDAVLRRRFGSWPATLEAFRRWAAKHAPDFPHMETLDARLAELAEPSGCDAGPVLPGSAAVPFWPSCGGRPGGAPLGFRAMMFAPANESGVLVLFGMVAAELGYSIQTVTPGFPDCTAMRCTAPGRWESVRVEFEYRSRSFRDHGHDAKGCDVIVCWEHDWPDCPLEVLALRPVIAALPPRQAG